MVSEFGALSGQQPVFPGPRAARWIAGLLGLKKAEPNPAAGGAAVQVPRRELERLCGTSPHLLADIGVLPAACAGATSPWRLKDGRQLLLRPPL